MNLADINIKGVEAISEKHCIQLSYRDPISKEIVKFYIEISATGNGYYSANIIWGTLMLNGKLFSESGQAKSLEGSVRALVEKLASEELTGNYPLSNP
jgi:hypothetical protein